MHSKWLLLWGIGIFLGQTWVWGQAENITRCHTMHHDSLLRAQYPELGTKDDFEAWMARHMEAAPETRATGVLTIPVIVHIVHPGDALGTGSNVSATRVQSQIDVLNEDFRRKVGTPGENDSPLGADVEIEFCLATVAPDGTPLSEPGIDRINSVARGWVALPHSDGYIKGTVMPATFWDPDQYMNIWTVDLQNDVLGFAQLPSQSTLPDLAPTQGPAATDGVVIDPDNFGRDPGLDAPYNKGRTTTHEVGHWLGLWHTWGDGDCDEDDYCSDTPPADGPHYGCSVLSFSCGSIDMIRNYMDYSDDSCMNIFTQCQRTRMRTVLENGIRRSPLLNSNVCSEELAPLPAFIADRQRLCAGGSIQFEDVSLYSPTTWNWSFPGGSPSASSGASPTVFYTQPGTYDVSLTVSNAEGSNSTTLTGYVEVLDAGEHTLFSEDFEEGLGDWIVVNPDSNYTWELASVSGNGGDLAPRVNMYLYANVGARDYLRSPLLNLSGFQTATLSFQHAYRPYSAVERDSLRVSASTDGGQSFPNVLLTAVQSGAAELATNSETTSDFVPIAEDEWCTSGANCFSLDMNALLGTSDIQIQFESINQYGNNVYVDNVLLTGSCAATTSLQAPATERWRMGYTPTGWRLFATEYLTYEVEANLYDMTGRLCQKYVLAQGQDFWDISSQGLPAGNYLFRIFAGDQSWQTKLQLP